MHFQVILYVAFLPYALLIENCLKREEWRGCTFDDLYFPSNDGQCYNCTYYDINQLDQITVNNSHTFVTISSGFIPTLTSKLVLNPSYIYFLKINNVRLEKIEDDALKLSKNLQKLDLSNNKLTSIQNFIFHNLYELEILVLSNNSIATLSVGSFVGLYALRKLDLSHNKLKLISVIIFHNTPILGTLDISYNFIDSIDASELKHLTGLTNINIDGNTKLNCTALSKALKLYKTLEIYVALGEAKNESSINRIPCFDLTENILIHEQNLDLLEKNSIIISNQEAIYKSTKTIITILALLLICVIILLILVAYKIFIRNQFRYKSHRVAINDDSTL